MRNNPPTMLHRYEGEFDTGFATGLGQYTAVDGEVYKGEWAFGKRHGCVAFERSCGKPLYCYFLLSFCGCTTNTSRGFVGVAC
jgi:MORN repeat